ncbi:MAG: ABC transporter ATP-binding protein [Thermodesulfobacteriota bacterium]
MTERAIEIKGYSFSVGSKDILTDVSLTVNDGEYLSIIGPNGAGKTTLLRCLNRILRGGVGEIRVRGRNIEDFSQRELAKVLSYVPQSGGAPAPFTVREFVMMGRYPHLSPLSSIKKADVEIVERALALTETEEFSGRLLSTLSGGERQKVYIAAAIAQGSGILLLDEPTTFLDPKHQDEIHAILRRLNREADTTIISVTHDINSAAVWSGRVVALRGGAVKFCGGALEVMDNNVLKEVYGKEFLFVTHPVTGIPLVLPGGAQ